MDKRQIFSVCATCERDSQSQSAGTENLAQANFTVHLLTQFLKIEWDGFPTDYWLVCSIKFHNYPPPPDALNFSNQLKLYSHQSQSAERVDNDINIWASFLRPRSCSRSSVSRAMTAASIRSLSSRLWTASAGWCWPTCRPSARSSRWPASTPGARSGWSSSPRTAAGAVAWSSWRCSPRRSPSCKLVRGKYW